MREIKFRFYSDYDKKMYQLSILDVSGGESACVYKGSRVPHELLEGETRVQEIGDGHLMQFTGMRYYNDKEEVYEHDVVKGKVFKKGKESRFIGVVKYSHYPTPGFYVEGVKQYEDLKESLHPLFKPIGNIYENPELVR